VLHILILFTGCNLVPVYSFCIILLHFLLMFRLNRDHFTRIARATGLNMVASTGLYHDKLMSHEHKDMSIEEVSLNQEVST